MHAWCCVVRVCVWCVCGGVVLCGVAWRGGVVWCADFYIMRVLIRNCESTLITSVAQALLLFPIM